MARASRRASTRCSWRRWTPTSPAAGRTSSAARWGLTRPPPQPSRSARANWSSTSGSDLPVSAVPSPPAARGRGRLVVCLLLAAVVLVAGFAGGRWAYLASQRRRALELARLGDFTGAAPLLERAFARDPDDAAVAAALARGYLDAGDDAAARPALDRWCRLRPDDPEPFRLRLALLRKDKKFEQAQADGLHLL